MQCIIQGCPSEQSDIRVLKVCHRVHSTRRKSLSAPFITRIIVPLLSIFRASTPPSSRPLKVATAAHNGHTLVHDRLADPEVAVDPLPDAGGFGDGV
jgi:hypothetical protein